MALPSAPSLQMPRADNSTCNKLMLRVQSATPRHPLPGPSQKAGFTVTYKQVATALEQAP